MKSDTSLGWTLEAGILTPLTMCASCSEGLTEFVRQVRQFFNFDVEKLLLPTASITFSAAKRTTSFLFIQCVRVRSKINSKTKPGLSENPPFSVPLVPKNTANFSTKLSTLVFCLARSRGRVTRLRRFRDTHDLEVGAFLRNLTYK
jgi:hypothetical protein